MEQSFVNFISSTPQPARGMGSPGTQEEDSQMGEPDHPVVTQINTTLYDDMRMPALIENHPRLQLPEVSNQDEIKLFSFRFLKEMFGGAVLSHGRYSIVSNNKPKGEASRPFPAVRGWAAFGRDYEPLLPALPTQHGVKISGFIQCAEDTETSRYSSERKIQDGIFITDIIRNSVVRIVLAAVKCLSFRSM
jgi:hypothetical protein